LRLFSFGGYGLALAALALAALALVVFGAYDSYPFYTSPSFYVSQFLPLSFSTSFVLPYTFMIKRNLVNHTNV